VPVDEHSQAIFLTIRFRNHSLSGLSTWFVLASVNSDCQTRSRVACCRSDACHFSPALMSLWLPLQAQAVQRLVQAEQAGARSRVLLWCLVVLSCFWHWKSAESKIHRLLL